MNITKDCLDKYNNGAPLTDAELKQLLEFFETMERGCQLLGSEFNIFRRSVRTDKECIQRYMDARLH